MFNFNVFMAPHDKIGDVGRATTRRRKFKASSLQLKLTKNEGPSENMGLNEKTVWRFQTKKWYNSNVDPWNKRPLNSTIDDGPCKQEEINGRKIERSVQI